MKIKTILAAMAAGVMAFGAVSAAAEDKPCTRGEFFSLIGAQCKANPLIYSGIFNDVSKENPYSDILEALVRGEIMDMEMAPQANINIESAITREEAVSLMVRGLRYKKSQTAMGQDVTFTDKDQISPWALSYVEVAVANGLIEDGGEFNPKGTLTSEQAEAMLTKMDSVYRSLPLLPGSGLMRIEFPVLEQPAGVERPSVLDEDYKLVFDDEFDGDTLNTNNWGYNYSWGHSHNHAAWCVPENVIVKDGVLTLLGENKQHPDAVDKNGRFNNKDYPIVYTSGAVNTHHKFNFNYGYFEARIKAPKGKGMWPAWWMLTDGWPPEIDMLEILCSKPNKLHVNYHWGPSWDKERSSEGVPDLGFDSSEDFHVYAFDWTPDYFKYYVDGKLIRTFTDKSAIAESRNMYMILNLAIDGWDGAPDSTTVWPAEYKIDYVRVWQKNQY